MEFGFKFVCVIGKFNPNLAMDHFLFINHSGYVAKTSLWIWFVKIIYDYYVEHLRFGGDQ